MGVIIRQKEKGKGKPWYVFINHQGKRTARKFSTKAVAVAAGREIERLLVSGEFGKEQKIIPNFEAYSQKWYDNYVSSLRESTQDEYESILRVHVLPVFGRKPLDSLTRGEIRDFLLNKFNGGLSKGRTLMIKDLIGSVLRYALDDELISANPIVGLSKKLFPKNSNKAKPITEADVYTEVQIEKLLAACKTMYPDYYLFFMIACKTGARLGECIALRWGDIDHEKGVIWVRRSFRRGRVELPKNGRQRKVKMSVPLAKALKSQLPKDIDALISDYDGYYLTQNQARRIYKQILKEADLEYIRIHGLRHSYATIMLTKGATPVFVKNQLGHSSISITVDLYGDHWLDDENNQADLIEMQPMQPDVAKTETFKGANSQLFEIASNN